MQDNVLAQLARLEERVSELEMWKDIAEETQAMASNQGNMITQKKSYPTPASYEEMYGPPDSWEDEPTEEKQAQTSGEKPWWKRLLFQKDTP